jgi:hypothetical protein
MARRSAPVTSGNTVPDKNRGLNSTPAIITNLGSLLRFYGCEMAVGFCYGFLCLRHWWWGAGVGTG